MTDFTLTLCPRPLDEAGEAFWPTPPWVTEALLKAHPLGTSWVVEPSAGEGAICKVLTRHGHSVVAVELRQECWMSLSDHLLGSPLNEIVIGDWLDFDPAEHVPPMVSWSIVGNPPYNPAQLMLRHAEKAVSLGADVVALLMPTNFLHSMQRARFHKEHPFSIMYAFARRPNTSPDGSSGGGQRDLSWFVWDRKIGPTMRVEVIV